MKLYKQLGHRSRARFKGYHRRWNVETAYSTLKRTFGTFSMAKTKENTTKELMAKATTYNMLLNP